MNRVQIPFVGPTYSARASRVNDQNCVNLYPVLESPGAKYPIALYSTPGMTKHSEFGVDGCRGDGVLYKERAYMVFGNRLVRINPDLSMTPVGTLNTSTGRVSMATDGVSLGMVDGIDGYVYKDDGTFVVMKKTDSSVDPANFGFVLTRPTHITVMDAFWVAIDAGSSNFACSLDVLKPLEWNAITVGVGQSRPATLQALGSTLRELVFLGTEEIQFWYNKANPLPRSPFSPIPQATIEYGIDAPSSLARVDGKLFWLGRGPKGSKPVLSTAGSGPSAISNSGMDSLTAKYTRTDDAYAFPYQKEGHSFYVLTFPTADKTWVYDLATGMWHQRASFGLGRHRAGGHVFAYGRNLIGDSLSGALYELVTERYDDDGDPIIRERKTSPISKNNQLIFWHGVQIEFDSGVGLISGQGSDPTCFLSWSDDGGHTWGPEMPGKIGKMGEYQYMTEFHALGASRERSYRVRMSDPVNWSILGAYGHISVGRV